MNRLRADRCVLGKAFRAPSNLMRLSLSEWTTLINDARQCNLLGALAVAASGDIDAFPAGPARHLRGMSLLSQRQALSVRWEVHRLHEALRPLGQTILLLKGAAYVMGECMAARGRMFGDIDILVPRDRLGDVESRLMINGWVSAKSSRYDQYYYRKWMHELPPMTHVRRGTVLDVHHNILPSTTRRHPKAEDMFARAVPIAHADLPWIRVPCPEDMLIHSATHLAHEGELDSAMRDLHDIDVMVSEFGHADSFWNRVCEYSTQQQLAGPVLLILKLAETVFGSNVPDHVISALGRVERTSVGALTSIYLNAIPFRLEERTDALAVLTRSLLYIRSHALRMPAHLLIPHLLVKAFAKLKPAATDVTDPTDRHPA